MPSSIGFGFGDSVGVARSVRHTDLFLAVMSLSEQEYISHSISVGVRLDGRAPCDFRPAEIDLGLIAQANGSSRLHLGRTDVLVGVKVEVGTPDATAPECGRIAVTVECSSCASPDYEVRGICFNVTCTVLSVMRDPPRAAGERHGERSLPSRLSAV